MFGIFVKSLAIGIIAFFATAGLVAGLLFHQAPVSTALVMFIVAMGLIPNRRPRVLRDTSRLALYIVRASALAFTVAGAAIVSTSSTTAFTAGLGVVVIFAATVFSFWAWIDKLNEHLTEIHYHARYRAQCATARPKKGDPMP